MSGFVLTDRERLLALEEAERTFPMTEDEFRVFYDLTARPVWVYINRMTGDGRLADDLLQEAYYRLLRTAATFESIYEEVRRGAPARADLWPGYRDEPLRWSPTRGAR